MLQHQTKRRPSFHRATRGGRKRKIMQINGKTAEERLGERGGGETVRSLTKRPNCARMTDKTFIKMCENSRGHKN